MARHPRKFFWAITNYVNKFLKELPYSKKEPEQPQYAQASVCRSRSILFYKPKWPHQKQHSLKDTFLSIIIIYLSSHCNLMILGMVSSLIQFHHTWEKTHINFFNKCNTESPRQIKIGKAPVFWPINSRIIHLIYDNKQFRHTQRLCKLNMFASLSTFFISSFKFTFSSRYNLT